ncbi:polysaccharide biosynthesis/export family protein [uncultured Sphingomonas sp.]|uniref:polysaccharide biosynthesis/export family protein n=1 Tax=uncultured Sphingomonas sp. TaxID=158754 RepID=UPI0025EA3865|nr:polysaccharide biosynthesis/export family protein [uncultured Sphingomonas sp.]
MTAYSSAPPLLSARFRATTALIGCALLAGCATLPSSGPTAGDIRRGERESNELGFHIVDVTPEMVKTVHDSTTAADNAQPTLASLAAQGRNDVVGPGDVLQIGVYEVGVSLFGSNSVSGGFAPSARGETFPAVVVDRDGAITLPYVGRLEVAGSTASEIQAMVVRGLRGKSQSPQALVVIRENVSRTVYVSGEVNKPGRMDLTLQQERLLDAIALAGGSQNSAEDTIVRFTRGTTTLEERLGRIRGAAPDDLTLVPGDRIELIKRPRSFIVLGASSKVSQVPFETGDLSLAEAVARAGGPTDAVADPSAVFLFRYDPAIAGTGEKPTIYRLDMMQPASYFLAQRFEIRDKDVIYIANAAANRPAKLVGIINQLFTPFVTARILTDNNR